MKVKVCPVCPMCKAPHDQEVDPGTRVKCPDCDQVYRAEAPEPSDPVARPRDRSGRKAALTSEKPAEKKKAPARERRSGDKLGKLIERHSPSQNRAALITIAIIAGLLGAVAAVVALVGVEPNARPWVLGVAGVFALVGAVCLLLLKFGGSSDFFEVRKKGVRLKTRRTEQYLFWEEIEAIDIRREIQAPGSRRTVLYTVTLVGSETIELTSAFMGSLDDPSGLIKALKRHSGKDFETHVG